MAYLFGADLRSTNLIGADLSGANLERVKDFRRARLEDSMLFMDISNIMTDKNTTLGWTHEWLETQLSRSANRDLIFNHFNNPSGSLLTTIDSIPDDRLRIEFLDRVASAILKHPDIKDVLMDLKAPLGDILFRRSAYISPDREENKNIRRLSTEVLPHIFHSATVASFDRSKTSLHRALLGFFETQILSNQGWAEKNNTELQYWLYMLGKSNHQDVREKTYTIKNTLIQMDFLKQLGAEHQEDDSLDEMQLLRERLLLTSEDRAVVLYDTCFNSLLLEDNSTTENRFPFEMFFYERKGGNGEYKNQPVSDICEALKPWPLLANAAEHRMAKLALSAILRESFVRSALLGDEFFDVFQQATKKIHFGKRNLSTAKILRRKLEFIRPQDEARLKKYFEPLFTNKMELRAEHLKCIFEIMLLNNETPCVQAYYLLVISAIFTKLSSSAFFGTEHHSPDILRVYAVGLIKSAQELYKGILDRESLQDWQDRLMGRGDTFTCSAVLFSIMQKKLRPLADTSSQLKPLFALIPPQW